MATEAAPDVQNLLICCLPLSDNVLMMEAKVFSVETLWPLPVYCIAQIVWGGAPPQWLVVRRNANLPCNSVGAGKIR